MGYRFPSAEQGWNLLADEIVKIGSALRKLHKLAGRKGIVRG